MELGKMGAKEKEKTARNGSVLADRGGPESECERSNLDLEEVFEAVSGVTHEI
jgi:hypothetical protein